MVRSQELQQKKPSSWDEKWFPRAIVPVDAPKLRVFCFPGAGMESSIWTTTGTAFSPMFNPFCEFAKKDAVSFFGVQLPSRGMRRKEVHPGTIQEAARQAMEAIRPLITRGNCPYVFVGYSMGSWLAYEVTCLAKKEGLPLPLHFIAAAMVSPNLPKKMRPWKCTSTLDTEGFQCILSFACLRLHARVSGVMAAKDKIKLLVVRLVKTQDQLRAWNCNEVLFHPDMWTAYEPLLRADHNMLDLYEYTDMKGTLRVPCSVFRGEQDKQLVEDALFQGWFEVLEQAKSEKPNAIIPLVGDHGLVFDAANRQAFFERIVDVLDALLLDIEYGK